MIVQLDDTLCKYTDQTQELNYTTDRADEALRMLFNQFPQLLVYILSGTKGSYGILVDGELIVDSNQLINTAGAFTVKIEVLPDGAWVELLVGTIIGIVVSVITNVIVDTFFSPNAPDPQIKNSKMGESATYTFDGIKNTTPAGTVSAVVYGTHRVGGHVLNMYTTTETTNLTTTAGPVCFSYYYLMAQIGLCEGEIADVSGLLVNKYPFNYYDGITSFMQDPSYLRHGTSTQTPMTQFSQIQNTTSIARKAVVASGVIAPTVIPATQKFIPVYGYIQTTPLGEISTLPMYGYYKLMWADPTGTSE